MRPRLVLPVAAVVLLLVALAGQPAMARRPHPAKPKPTTTVAPTTTTVAPTTTTAVGGCSPGTPIIISAGGIYSGCYESTDPAVPAVKITTAEPITLDHATIRHAERGIVEWPNAGVAVNLTVTNSKLTAFGPDTTASQRAIELDKPASLVVEHTLLTDGGGIWVGLSGGSPMSTLRVRYNDAVNIARWQASACSGGTCRQFFQADHETVAGDVSWNRVTNTYGASWPEDNINLYATSGTGEGGRFVIDHNLINGAFPKVWTGADWSGGGILVGDSSGSYNTISGNRVVGTTNYGLMISGGQHNRMTDNRSIHDNTLPDGTTVAMSSGGVAAANWCYQSCGGPVDNDVTGNTLGLESASGTRNDLWCPAVGTDPASECSGNTTFTPTDITPADEQAEVTAWAAEVAAAGLTVGPDW